jgi:hypothetical protein
MGNYTPFAGQFIRPLQSQSHRVPPDRSCSAASNESNFWRFPKRSLCVLPDLARDSGFVHAYLSGS